MTTPDRQNDDARREVAEALERARPDQLRRLLDDIRTAGLDERPPKGRLS